MGKMEQMWTLYYVLFDTRPLSASTLPSPGSSVVGLQNSAHLSVALRNLPALALWRRASYSIVYQTAYLSSIESSGQLIYFLKFYYGWPDNIQTDQNNILHQDYTKNFVRLTWGIVFSPFPRASMLVGESKCIFVSTWKNYRTLISQVLHRSWRQNLL